MASYPLDMRPTNRTYCICSIEELRRAVRLNVALGAFVGLLLFTLMIVTFGWVKTYLVLRGRSRGEIRRNLHQVTDRYVK